MYNVPRYYLLFLTSFAGAALMVAGALVLINVVNLEDLKDGAFQVVSNQGFFWKLVWLGLGIAGFGSQLTSTHEADLQWAAEWGNGKKG